MRRLLGWLMIGLVAVVGCGGPRPAAPETEAQGASRVFALAQDLENSKEAKRAMEAYQQIVRHFPETPEARKATERIFTAQKKAMQNASTRKRK
jgi:outer membrane protein assembly factor BamD (BamD/ComL family)